MKQTHRIKKTLMLLVAGLLIPCISIAASLPTDPLGGKPPAGAKQSVMDLDYQVKYQRAFEAVLWSMPAVGMYAYWHASSGLGRRPQRNYCLVEASYPHMEGVTGNNQTPYILSQTDLSKGPVVLEVPAATEKATLYGTGRRSLADQYCRCRAIGTGQGQRRQDFVYASRLHRQSSCGYIEVKSPSYRVTFAFRSIKGKNATTADAYAYSKTLKMYYLSELPNPKPTKFVNPAGTGKRWAALPHFDERWFRGSPRYLQRREC